MIGYPKKVSRQLGTEDVWPDPFIAKSEYILVDKQVKKVFVNACRGIINIHDPENENYTICTALVQMEDSYLHFVQIECDFRAVVWTKCSILGWPEGAGMRDHQSS